MCAPRPHVSRQVAKNSLVRTKQDVGIPKTRSKENALALCNPILQLSPYRGAATETFRIDFELITNLI